MAEVKMASPNETVIWVDKAGVVDPYAPTDVELNAGANVSCAIALGYSMNFTDPDFDTSRTICDEGNAQNPTVDNYEVNITFYRSDLVTTTAVFVTAWNLFRDPDVEGYFYRRVGKGYTAPIAVGDLVSMFGVKSDIPQDVIDGNAGVVQFRQEFIRNGDAEPNIVVVVAP